MPIGLGAPVSISAMRKDWFLAFKDYKACSEVSEQLLWWTPDNIFNENQILMIIFLSEDGKFLLLKFTLEQLYAEDQYMKVSIKNDKN
jgi:hypothetical protein